MGEDDFGRELMRRYSDEGIVMTYAKRLAGEATGTALIFLGTDGQNAIGIYAAANSKLSRQMVENLPSEAFSKNGVFLACLEIPLETVCAGLRRAKAAGMTTILNPAPFNPAILDKEILGLVDIITPNEEEAMGLTGRNRPCDAAERLIEQGAKTVVVTLGSEGALRVAADEASAKAFPAHAIKVVDTVGAGDAFNGALAAALAAGRSCDAAIGWAVAAASLSVAAEGAQGGLPDRARIDEFLRSTAQ